MRIGYPCINKAVGCTANATFRLANYSDAAMEAKLGANLACAKKILDFNARHGLLFFRISSDLVPFASHPICSFDWRNYFRQDFADLGAFARKSGMRIGMHPDQFVLINAAREHIVDKSIAELEYHCAVLDTLGLDGQAKVQIHVGGVYGDRRKSKERFIETYERLPEIVRGRLVIENDDRMYGLADCLDISEKTGVPVVFDVFHHECLNRGENLREGMREAQKTWKESDGIPIVDYSLQKPGARKGSHADHIDRGLFDSFLGATASLDFDLMLEIKDKERSALIAAEILRSRKEKNE